MARTCARSRSTSSRSPTPRPMTSSSSRRRTAPTPSSRRSRPLGHGPGDARAPAGHGRRGPAAAPTAARHHARHGHGHVLHVRAAQDPMAGMDHAAMGHVMPAPAGPALPGMAPPRPRGSDVMGGHAGPMTMDMSMLNTARAPQVKMGPGVQMIAPMPLDRTGEPGQGLASVGHQVLVYRDLVALEPNPDTREPSRALTDPPDRQHGAVHVGRSTGGSSARSRRPTPSARASGCASPWSTTRMMAHPIHLHGHFFELEHGPPGYRAAQAYGDGAARRQGELGLHRPSPATGPSTATCCSTCTPACSRCSPCGPSTERANERRSPPSAAGRRKPPRRP